MNKKNSKAQEIEHTHEDGTTHKHIGGDKKHEHKDVIKKEIKVSTSITTKVERMIDVTQTWNEIGIYINSTPLDEYAANNVYVILQDALKKIQLADK